MRTSISKKLLAGALSVMMVLSLFAGVPANKAQAAASVKVTGKTAVYTGTTNTYKVVNLKKAQYVKVSVTGDAKKLVTVKKGGKKLATTKKVYGGKTITLKVANKKAAGKKYTLVVKAYKKGATKPFKTIKKTVTVYSKTTSVTLDQTEATLKVGETVTLTATKKPAKNTKAIKWTSSDETVATVADGVVTAVAAGTATIKATSGAKSATATITVEEVKKEAELVELKATGAKKLTATLTQTAEITAKDIVVKKGTVTLTPAEVVVDGTNLVITLGSKITEGTYSLTYKEKTLEVKTEDEKLVALKTVGNALAEIKDDATLSINTKTDACAAVGVAQEPNTVAAQIEFQALNQYDEPTNAEITSVTTTFGGTAKAVKEPTAKKNGLIQVVNINAALGIVGNTGKVIIVSKSGVSSSNDVTFSEEAKVAKVEIKGIYNTATSKYVDAIPANTTVSNYVLVIKAFDQYENDVTDKYNKFLVGQAISQAQVIANVKVDGVVSDKLTAASFNDALIINGESEVGLKLVATDSNPAYAGTLQIVIVGNRFGTVLNTTIKVEQVKLLKSFKIELPDRIYDMDANALAFTALDEAGNEVKSYKELTKLVAFGANSYLGFVKNTDGTAKLIYTPTLSKKVKAAAGPTPAATLTGELDDTNTNLKEYTVKTETITLNDAFSKTEQVVTTQSFTVYEAKVAVSIVKFTGETATADDEITLKKSKFVFEDQYGNTMTGAEHNYGNIQWAYTYGDDETALTPAANLTLDVTRTAKKLYLGVFVDSTNTNILAANKLVKDKAQLTISLVNVDPLKATSLTATYYGDLYGYIKYVGVNAAESGISYDDFKVTGVVNGNKITLDSDMVSLKSDSYEKITKAEQETAVKTAKVVLVVTLTDDDGEYYAEEVESEYKYSAMNPYVASISGNEQAANGYEYYTVGYGYRKAGQLTTSDLYDMFGVYDQYGDNMGTNLTFDVQTGANTNGLKVINQGADNAYVEGFTAANTGAVLNVTATTKNGLTCTVKVVVTGEAATTAEGEGLAKAKTDIAGMDIGQRYANYPALANAIVDLGDGYVKKVVLTTKASGDVEVIFTDDATKSLTFGDVSDKGTYSNGDVLYISEQAKAALKTAADDACAAYLAATSGVNSAAKYAAIATAKTTADNAISAYDAEYTEAYATTYAAKYAETYTAAGAAKAAIDEKITSDKTAAGTLATVASYAALKATLKGEIEKVDYVKKITLTTKGTNGTADTEVTIDWIDGSTKTVTYTVTDVTDIPANDTDITAAVLN